MLKNYFMVTLRNYFKRGNRFFTFINISGLVIGLAAFLILTHLVRYELSYDESFTDAANLFRVKVEKFEKGEVAMQSAKTYPGLGQLVKSEVPEVRDFVRI